MDLFTAAKSVSILEVYKAYGPKTKMRKGRKSIAVPCIFHEDNHPSLNLYLNDNSFFCFQCHRKGSGIDLVMELLHLDNISAAKRICQDFGVEYEDVKTKNMSPEAQAIADSKKELLELNTALSKCFHLSLAKAPNPNYFHDRGLGSLVDAFELGYCPKGRLFNKIEKGMSYGLCNESGECVFAGRYIVPIKDIHGMIIGFIGRLPDEEVSDSKPKYINSCNSALFRKREVFFNAQSLLSDSDKILIVEGIFDALSYIAAGVTDVISPLGLSLSDNHLEILRKFTRKTIILAFDRDKPGIEATRKALCYSKNLRLSVLISDYKLCKDANELLIKEGGAYLATATESLSAPEYVLKVFEAGSALDTLQGHERLWTVMAKILGYEERKDLYPINKAYTPVAYRHYWSLYDKTVATHPIK